MESTRINKKIFDKDGWLITNDLGYLDKNDNLVLAGRKDDMFIRGGYNIYPLEVENIIMSHPDIEMAAVIGVKAPVIGQTGVAFISLKNKGIAFDEQKLKDWCEKHMTDYKIPEKFVVLTQLPLNTMMKIDKKALREIPVNINR